MHSPLMSIIQFVFSQQAKPNPTPEQNRFPKREREREKNNGG